MRGCRDTRQLCMAPGAELSQCAEDTGKEASTQCKEESS